MMRSGSPIPRAQILEEGSYRLDVFFEPAINPRETFASVFENAPGEHRLAPLPGPKPLGNAVDERIDDRLLRQIPLTRPCDSDTIKT